MGKQKTTTKKEIIEDDVEYTERYRWYPGDKAWGYCASYFCSSCPLHALKDFRNLSYCVDKFGYKEIKEIYESER